MDSGQFFQTLLAHHGHHYRAPQNSKHLYIFSFSWKEPSELIFSTSIGGGFHLFTFLIDSPLILGCSLRVLRNSAASTDALLAISNTKGARSPTLALFLPIHQAHSKLMTSCCLSLFILNICSTTSLAEPSVSRSIRTSSKFNYYQHFLTNLHLRK